MPDKAARLAEAYRRGILPPDKAARYEEAMRRGVVPNVKAEAPNAPAEATPEPSSMDSMLRGLGLGTRSALQGVGSLADLAITPAMTGINALNEALGGAPNYFETSTGKGLSDILGLPQPETKQERTLSAIQEGAAGALPTLGAGFAMQAAGKAPTIAELLTTMPKLQVVSGATGGLASQTAAEGGAGAGGQIAAGVGGALIPVLLGAVGGTARAAGRTALSPFTEKGQTLKAAETLERMAQNPESARMALARGGDVLIEGSQPTLAQITQDPGLAYMEKGLASKPLGGEITQRYLDQRAAQQAVTGEVLDPALARLEQQAAQVEPQLRAASPYGGRLGEEAVGIGVRGAFEPEYAAMRGRVRQAYENIDPENLTSFNVRPLLADFEAITQGGGRYQAVPSSVKNIITQMQDDLAQGRPISYKDLQGARTQLTDLAQSASVSGDASTQRIAGLMKRSIDNFVEQAAAPEQMTLARALTPELEQQIQVLRDSGMRPEAIDKIIDQLAPPSKTAQYTGFTPEQAEQFGLAKRLRTEQGQRFEAGANIPLTRSGKSLSGEAIAESKIPATFFQPGGIGGENIRALRNAAPEAMKPMRDYVIGRVADITGSTKMNDFLRNYGPALSEMGDADLQRVLQTAARKLSEVEAGKAGLSQIAKQDVAGDWALKRGQTAHPEVAGNVALTPQEQQRIAAVQQDIQRALDATRLAQVGGSPTAQNLNVQAALSGFGIPMRGPVSGLLNQAIGMATSQGNEAVTRAILDAVLDPERARQLMTMQRPERLLDSLKRYGTAGGVSAGREAIR